MPVVETTAPPGGLWRIGRWPDPLTAVASEPLGRHIGDRRAGNRFDDPLGRWGVLYAGTTKQACFAETLSRFRPSPAVLAVVEDEWRAKGWMNLGNVPADWRQRRLLVQFNVPKGSRFLDVDTAETLAVVSVELSPMLAALGISEHLDIGMIRGADRAVTRYVGMWVADQRNDDGTPRYAGVRYRSRLDSRWECWAIFDHTDRFELAREPITRQDPALLEVAALWGLAVH